MCLIRVFVFLALIGAPFDVSANPLLAMGGSWRGSGWARETPTSPKEAVSCRLRNTYDAAEKQLNVTGKCAVPGRQFTLSGQILATKGSDRITGRWSNPDGIGSVAITGISRADVIAFTFSAADPFTDRAVSLNVEWRLTNGKLRLRSSERTDATLGMSDITFTR